MSAFHFISAILTVITSNTLYDFNACYSIFMLFFFLSPATNYLCDGRELLPGNGPDRSWRGSVTSNGSSDDFSKNTKRRSLLVVVPDLVGGDFKDSHPWVLGSTSVDTISLVSEPCLDGGIV